MKRWTAKIGNMLPSLTHLTMSDVHINEDDFYQLFGNFSNLRSLDISGTNILNIAGISRLKQLEVLALRDFSIATYTELKDLFNLKHLRVLDVSQTRFNLHSRNNIVEQFTECKMELPELRFMDCTRTSLSGDILECLLKTQRNLQLVTTIMTEAETSQYNDVRVLNTAYFHKSVQALVYCLTARKEFDSGYCMKAIRISISEDNLQNLNIPSCIKTIVKSMQTFDSISVTQNGLKCLIIFGMLYSNQLCSNGVTLLVEALMSFVYLYKRMISEAYVKVNISYWNAVEKLVNLKLGKLDFDKISKTAMSFLLENRVSKALRTRASSVLCQCIHRMHSDELKSLSEKTENVNRLVDILEWSVGQKNETKLSEFFEITIKMTEKSSKACTNMIQAGIISISLSCMEKVESNDITTKCLELLTNLSSALNYDSLQELYTSSNVDKIGLMLTRQKNDITFQTTSLLTKLLHHAEGNQVQYKLINQLLAESNRLAIGIDKIHI
ncbi:Zer-1-like leucine-rich repeats region domain-containing protein [Caenorhabditis elegans]|nr:TIR domain-containing protein [Caenorhabditis elegans]CAJ76935.2 TIR domain-containing protein [Caenorhabditis elegans]|eukprot:NP_001040929.2 Uncharacterized protein CELE_C48D1.1 [Caenorhabditis elegans]